MYIPAYFKEDRISVLHDTIKKIGFASLVTSGEDGIEASHLPMLLSSDLAPFGTLHGHVARANPQWKVANHGGKALAIFLGPNTYVTPSWYPTKQETGKAVPTWNYLAIHAYGEISFFDDPIELRDHVSELTNAHEASRASPWAVTDAPADFVDRLLSAIVGFKLNITRLEGKWKMSQNRSSQDVSGVHDGLVKEGTIYQKSVAEVMEGLAGK